MIMPPWEIQPAIIAVPGTINPPHTLEHADTQDRHLE